MNVTDRGIPFWFINLQKKLCSQQLSNLVSLNITVINTSLRSNFPWDLSLPLEKKFPRRPISSLQISQLSSICRSVLIDTLVLFSVLAAVGSADAITDGSWSARQLSGKGRVSSRKAAAAGLQLIDDAIYFLRFWTRPCEKRDFFVKFNQQNAQLFS